MSRGEKATRSRVEKTTRRAGLLRRDDVVWLYTCNKEKIPAVHVKPPRNPRSPAAGEGLTILYSHGNAEDVGLHLPFIDALARATGCDVLSYEYVGYSLSRFANCQPDEEGCYRSIDAAWVCVRRVEISPTNRGDAAGCHVDGPRRRVAAPPRGATWMVRGGESRRRHVDIPRRRVAAPPRGATWIVRGDESRRRRGVPRGQSEERTRARALERRGHRIGT